jgi:adenosylhomocysteine nucleosidase
VIGVVIPLKLEAKTFLKEIEDLRPERSGPFNFHRGRLGSHELAVIVGGHGKIKTAAHTQSLIENYKPRAIIHIGTCGGIGPDIEIGEIITPKTIFEHDFKVMIPEFEKFPQAKTDKILREGFHRFLKTKEIPINDGNIASGNENIVTKARGIELHERFHAIAADWESAACAQVCNFNDVPILVARVIVDLADEALVSTFELNAPVQSDRLGKLLSEYLKSNKN